MITLSLLADGPISVLDYRCGASPSDAPFAEHHQQWSVSYVRRGSFGCLCRGKSFDLVPGSVLVGRPGDEYTCTHEHHGGGDECLAFFIDPALVDELDRNGAHWCSMALPPLADLMVLGELGQAVATGNSDLGLDNIALAFAARCVKVLSGRSQATARPMDRARMITAALWIEAHCEQPIALNDMSREIGLSSFHFLRTFSAALGVSPHQYLLRCRLRKAARLLTKPDHSITDVALEVGFADLSNFVRSFHRAAGVSPRAYRRAAAGNRKIFQE